MSIMAHGLAHEMAGMRAHTSHGRGDVMKQQPGRVLLQFPISREERRLLKHQAIDQGITLGEIVRKALGFPSHLPVAKAENAAMSEIEGR